MKIGLIKRLSKAYCTVGRTFNIWIVTILVGIYLLTIRTINFIFMKFDWLLYPLKLQKQIESPILIVGNPRSGTTFIHRYLVNNGLGVGSRLYQMIFTSVIIANVELFDATHSGFPQRPSGRSVHNNYFCLVKKINQL